MMMWDSNTFELSRQRQVVSKRISQVCEVMTVHLGPGYIQLLDSNSGQRFVNKGGKKLCF